MKVDELNSSETRLDTMIGKIGKILSPQERKRGVLIHSFQKIQEEHGYLPEEILKTLSKELSLPIAEIYSVASFYKQFHFAPRGKKVVRVCTGTACHVRGAKKVLSGIEEEFGIKQGETTEDLKLTLETVGCVGCCGLAPVVTVNEEVVGDITDKKLNAVINYIKED